MDNHQIATFKDLIVWQKAMLLVEKIYSICNHLPDIERFNLQQQIQRSAVSIPSNIAEGRARGSKKDFAHFLHIAYGSTCEVETQLLLAQKIYKIDIREIEPLLVEIQKMLVTIIKKLKY